MICVRRNVDTVYTSAWAQSRMRSTIVVDGH